MSYLRSFTDSIQQKRILGHVLFWLAILMYALSKNLIDQGNNLQLSYAKSLSLFIPQIFASYIISYLIIDKVLIKKKYIVSVILLYITVHFFSALGRVLIVHVAEATYRKPPFRQETILEIFLDVKYLFLYYAPSIIYTVFIFLFIRYFLNYKKITERELATRNEKVASELKTLKAQLNPHFLFNTLNNIYVLSLDNSPKTPKSIEKLSSILDHVLYRCNDRFVSLNSEIELLKNYIELEKLRYDDRLQVSFNTNVEYEGKIAPLILLSLVENAFKHGAGEDIGSPKIDILVENSISEFKFVISNTVASKENNSQRTPIGLKNIKKQLNLVYSNNFKLLIDSNSSLFTVTIIIKNQ